MVRPSGQVRGPRAVLYLRVLPRVARPLAAVMCHLEPYLQDSWRLGLISLVYRATRGVAGSLQSGEKRAQSLHAVFAGRAAGMVVDGRGWCEAASIF